MSPASRSGIVLAALMATSSVLAYALRPSIKLIDIEPRERLETLVPMQFGDWRSRPSGNIVLADPQMQANLARIYTETLSRTYSDSHGRQVMLSIAYGDNQSDSMNMHYPEVCYPAQGFQTRAIATAQLATPFGGIRAKRLEMQQGNRFEPITYWTMIGDRQSLGGADKKINEMQYSLRGLIPDGLLLRVSSIERDTDKAYRDQEQFIGALLDALSPAARKRLAGL